MNDLEFIQACLEGDRRSWDQFIERYSRLIYSYILSVAKVKGLNLAPDSVNDLFQELILSLLKDNFRKLRTYRGKNGCSCASWLRQVTINFTLDFARRLKPLVSIDEENEEGLTLKELLRDNSISVRDKFTQNELLSHLKDCVAFLDGDDKYFIELYLNRGLSLGDISVHLKIARPAVDMRKFRIINRLKNCFKTKGLELGF
jgi:RNA polymerase sigma-70 factor (ECF subfamily)